MKKRLNSKTQFFILIFVYIIILVLWYFGFYEYINSQLTEIKNKEVQLQQSITQLPQVYRETQRINSVVDSIQTEIDKINSKVTTINELNTVKKSFNNFCQSFNLSCEEFNPLVQIFYKKQSESPDEKYVTLPINLRITGNFNNFINFNEKLYSFEYIFSPQYVEIIPDEKKENYIIATVVSNLLVKNETN